MNPFKRSLIGAIVFNLVYGPPSLLGASAHAADNSNYGSAYIENDYTPISAEEMKRQSEERKKARLNNKNRSTTPDSSSSESSNPGNPEPKKIKPRIKGPYAVIGKEVDPSKVQTSAAVELTVGEDNKKVETSVRLSQTSDDQIKKVYETESPAKIRHHIGTLWHYLALRHSNSAFHPVDPKTRLPRELKDIREKRSKVTLKDIAKGGWHFGLESTIFAASLGAIMFLQLKANPAKNPVAFEQQLDSLKDPIGHLSFYSFMAMNGFATDFLSHPNVMGRIQSKALQRTYSQMIPYMSMAAGSMTSHIVGDIANTMKACGTTLWNRGKGQTPQMAPQAATPENDPCELAWKQWTLEKKYQMYVPTLISLMLSTALSGKLSAMGMKALGATKNAVAGKASSAKALSRVMKFTVWGSKLGMNTFGGPLRWVIGFSRKLGQFTIFNGIDHLVHHLVADNVGNFTRTYHSFFPGVDTFQEKANVFLDLLETEKKNHFVGAENRSCDDNKINIEFVGHYCRSESRKKDLMIWLDDYADSMKGWRELNQSEALASHQGWLQKVNNLKSVERLAYHYNDSLISDIQGYLSRERELKAHGDTPISPPPALTPNTTTTSNANPSTPQGSVTANSSADDSLGLLDPPDESNAPLFAENLNATGNAVEQLFEQSVTQASGPGMDGVLAPQLVELNPEIQGIPEEELMKMVEQAESAGRVAFEPSVMRLYPLFGVVPMKDSNKPDEKMTENTTELYIKRPDLLETYQLESIKFLLKEYLKPEMQKQSLNQDDQKFFQEIIAGLEHKDVYVKGTTLNKLRWAANNVKDVVDFKLSWNGKALAKNFYRHLGEPTPMLTYGQGFSYAYTLGAGMIPLDAESGTTVQSILDIAKIDYLFGPYRRDKQVDFFTYQMLCGADLDQSQSTIKERLGMSDEFIPPSLIKKSVKPDICDFSVNAKSSAYIYTETIKDKASGKSYKGFLDLLLPNLRDDLTSLIHKEVKEEDSRFPLWWNSRVEPQIKAMYEKYKKEYQQIAAQFVETLYDSDHLLNRGTVPSSVAISTMQEMRMYSLVLAEIVKDRMAQGQIAKAESGPLALYSSQNLPGSRKLKLTKGEEVLSAQTQPWSGDLQALKEGRYSYLFNFQLGVEYLTSFYHQILSSLKVENKDGSQQVVIGYTEQQMKNFNTQRETVEAYLKTVIEQLNAGQKAGADGQDPRVVQIAKFCAGKIISLAKEVDGLLAQLNAMDYDRKATRTEEKCREVVQAGKKIRVGDCK